MAPEGQVTKSDVLAVLGHVYDPDYRDRSIVEMGLVDQEGIAIEGGRVHVCYRLTAPVCPFSAAIGLLIRHALEVKLDLPVEVRIVAGHFQEDAVSAILQSEEKSRQLLEQMQSYGILEQCIRW